MNAALKPAEPTALKRALQGRPRQLLIAGRWRPAASGQVLDVFDPATGEVFAQAAAGAAEDIDLAVRAAVPDSDGVRHLTTELLEEVLQRKLSRYDKAGDEHYQLISALHESVRNSDPNL